MRQFLRIWIVAAAVLAAYFGYVYLDRPEVYQARARDAGLLVGLLDDYRAAKGMYPVLGEPDVSVARLNDVLAASGVAFHSRMRFNDFDSDGRYVSVTGRSFGLLWHFHQSDRPAACIVEVRMHDSGAWGQPPACRW